MRRKVIRDIMEIQMVTDENGGIQWDEKEGSDLETSTYVENLYEKRAKLF